VRGIRSERVGSLHLFDEFSAATAWNGLAQLQTGHVPMAGTILQSRRRTD
jgi:hypothetical protein